MNSTTLAQVPPPPRHATHGVLRNGLQFLVMLLSDFFAFVVEAVIATAVTLPPGTMSGSNVEAIWLSQWTGIGFFAALVLVWLLWFGTIRQAYTRRKSFWTELLAKPGKWQVSGRDMNWSLWSDIAILFKTISVFTGRSGAY